ATNRNRVVCGQDVSLDRLDEGFLVYRGPLGLLVGHSDLPLPRTAIGVVQIVGYAQRLLVVASFNDTLNPLWMVGHFFEFDRVGETRVNPLLDAPIDTLLRRVNNKEMAHLGQLWQTSRDVDSDLKGKQCGVFLRSHLEAFDAVLAVYDTERANLGNVE